MLQERSAQFVRQPQRLRSRTRGPSCLSVGGIGVIAPRGLSECSRSRQFGREVVDGGPGGNKKPPEPAPPVQVAGLLGEGQGFPDAVRPVRTPRFPLGPCSTHCRPHPSSGHRDRRAGPKSCPRRRVRYRAFRRPGSGEPGCSSARRPLDRVAGGSVRERPRSHARTPGTLVESRFDPASVYESAGIRPVGWCARPRPGRFRRGMSLK